MGGSGFSGLQGCRYGTSPWSRPLRARPRPSRCRLPAPSQSCFSSLRLRLLLAAPACSPAPRAASHVDQLRRAVFAWFQWGSPRLPRLGAHPVSAPTRWRPWCWRTGRCCRAGPLGPLCRLLGKWVSKPGRAADPLCLTCPPRLHTPLPESIPPAPALFHHSHLKQQSPLGIAALGAVFRWVRLPELSPTFLQCFRPAW